MGRSHLSRISIALLALAASRVQAQTGPVTRIPATTRAEVVRRAKELAGHQWVCKAANLQATCSTRYKSDWKAGQSITGLPYGWGKMDDITMFDRKLTQGLAAGGHSQLGVLSCTAGIDCSGFVTLCWGLNAGSHAYTTGSLRQIAGKPKYNWFSDMKPGDALDKPGSHVVLFMGYNADGSINVCEASGSAARVICHATTWSRYKGYIPLQYKGIDD